MDVYNDTVEVEMETVQDLGDWVYSQVIDWRTDYDTNYEEKFKEYYRLWRGIWAQQDKERETERSKLVSPALQQAVESNVAEVEEATFGRGDWFDIRDNLGDESKTDVEALRNMLAEEFTKRGIRKAIGEVLINAAVFGTGIAEVVLDTVEEEKAATQPVMGGQLTAFGIEKEERVVVGLNPILPQNFVIDPAATCISDALGAAVDKFVGYHTVKELQENGTYFDVPLGLASTDTDLEADPELPSPGDNNADRVRLIKYYGKVPTKLLEEYEEDLPDTLYTEAEVVLANDGSCVLKAQKNPNMFSRDRALIAFPWDVVPGRFWGRGVCEKGFNVQKALDTEMRARIDALALTVAPMMAMDANKKLQGHNYAVRPGKVWLTQGPPSDAFMPLNIGDIKQSSFAQTGALQEMLQQATGAVDSNGVGGAINGEATAAGISMSLGAIIKRHKRTLINFHQGFLEPFIKKAACRYMQYDPERFGFGDYSFTATGTSGIMAREYEVTQLGQLLQSMPPDSPLYPKIVEAMVDSMALNNRETLMATLQEASKPNPEAQQAAQAQQQAALRFQNSQATALESQAQKDQAAAQKTMAEAQAIPEKLRIDLIKASTTNLNEGSDDEKEFEKRIRVAELMLQEKKIDNEKEAKEAKERKEAEMMSSILGGK